MMKSDAAARSIFKRGSKTYYFSSLFFPEPYRSAIVTLYAFVRTADDFVDQVPPDARNFYRFMNDTWRLWDAAFSTSDPPTPTLTVISNFVNLAREVGIEKSLVEAFFASMELDLVKSRYQTLDETKTYMYGSAEVIGLMIVKIFDLPKTAEPTARLLGRAMQFINMIRDVADDEQLGRQYLPTESLKKYQLDSLTKADALKKPSQFSAFIHSQLDHQAEWMLAARSGFHYLPRSLRIPVQTAADMYDWTARQIEKNPAIVWDHPVKPSRWRVTSRAVWLWIVTYR